MKTFLKICLVVVTCHSLTNVNAQSNQSEDQRREKLIAATQGAASQLYFEMDSYKGSLAFGSFSNPAEFYVRKGLPHFFAKAKKRVPLTVAYIGGSITQTTIGYRLQSAAFIQKMFGSIKMKGINAGVSGTGTDLGACRIREQVLKYHPDLIFIEFAVNGAYAEGMEGIVRQIRKSDPLIDICFVYTIYSGQTAAYAAGGVPDNIKGLEAIADHYNIPSVHMGLQPSLLEKAGQLVWKGDPKNATDKIIFSADGTHPLEAGGSLYAGAIARAFIAMKDITVTTGSPMPAALLADQWEDAAMLDPLSAAHFSNGWKRINTKGDSVFSRYEPWFPYVMQADAPGQALCFKFKGSMFGFFDIGGPESGQLEVKIDGKPVKLKELPLRGIHISKVVNTGSDDDFLVNRFNAFCNNRHRGQYQFIQLDPGVHAVELRVSPVKADKEKILGEKQTEDIHANPAKYDRTAITIGKILVRGKMVK